MEPLLLGARRSAGGCWGEIRPASPAICEAGNPHWLLHSYVVTLAAVRQVPARRAEPAPHLARLSGDWALWRTFCLRGAGFPVGLLADLGAPALASAADAVNAGP